MTFDEEFELLVDAEFDARTNNKIKRLLKNSSIPDTTAHIGGIEFRRLSVLPVLACHLRQPHLAKLFVCVSIHYGHLHSTQVHEGEYICSPDPLYPS